MTKWRFEVTAVLLTISSACFGLAKPNQAAATAPLPPAITAAKTVFLSNLCSDTYSACTKIYNEFYAALQSQTKYTLVLAPAQADIVFEIHLSTRLAGVTGSAESGPVSTYGTTLQLIIFDRATRVALWSILESGSRKVSAAEQILADLKTITTENIAETTPNHPLKTPLSDERKK